MADEPGDVKKVRETKVRDPAGTTEQTTREVVDPEAGRDRQRAEENRDKRHAQDVIVRVIEFLYGIVFVILGLRFVLALAAANPANGFANFIYTISKPLASPFISLFNYNVTPGKFQFDFAALVAILIYGLITYGVVKLVTINRR